MEKWIKTHCDQWSKREKKNEKKKQIIKTFYLRLIAFNHSSRPLMCDHWCVACYLIKYWCSNKTKGMIDWHFFIYFYNLNWKCNFQQNPANIWYFFLPHIGQTISKCVNACNRMLIENSKLNQQMSFRAFGECMHTKMYFSRKFNQQCKL